jgi:hypothetical protein
MSVLYSVQASENFVLVPHALCFLVQLMGTQDYISNRSICKQVFEFKAKIQHGPI